MLGPVYWQTFDWPSFATLFTGIAAVVAAYAVGSKQASVSRQQTTILGRQVELEESKLRADLFDRRLATFETAADFLIHFSRVADENDEAKAHVASFAQKMRESRFIFHPGVYAGLWEIWEKGNEMREALFALRAARDAGYDTEAAKRHGVLISWSLGRLDTLHELFAADLAIKDKWNA